MSTKYSFLITAGNSTEHDAMTSYPPLTVDILEVKGEGKEGGKVHVPASRGEDGRNSKLLSASLDTSKY